MNTSTLAALREALLFSQLDDRALEALAAEAYRRRLRAGERLLHEGEPGEALYVIVSGRVKVQRTGAGGLAVLATRGPGETIGELAVLDDGPRMADAVAVEPTEVLAIRRRPFLQCLESHPAVALALVRVLADRLREAGDALASRSQDVLGRVARVLLEAARREGVTGSPSGVVIPASLTQVEIAERASTTPETVCRAMRKLERAGAVGRAANGRLEIRDEEILRGFTER